MQQLETQGWISQCSCHRDKTDKIDLVTAANVLVGQHDNRKQLFGKFNTCLFSQSQLQQPNYVKKCYLVPVVSSMYRRHYIDDITLHVIRVNLSIMQYWQVVYQFIQTLSIRRVQRWSKRWAYPRTPLEACVFGDRDVYPNKFTRASALLRFKTSRYFLSQLEGKPKQIATRTNTVFLRLAPRLHTFALSFDWFTALSDS